MTILPWFGSARVPAMFVWTGPWACVIWAPLVVAVGQIVKWPRVAGSVRWAVIVVAAVMTAFAYGAWRSAVIDGDEPHFF